MSVRTKKTFAWLWMAALLTATMGISVQQIYCYCAGKTSISIFVVQDGDGCTAEKPIPEVVARFLKNTRLLRKRSLCAGSGAQMQP
ncbi:MAG: hypothetical protein IPK76_15225 [Lewinellaceae bacterium]|nr:hypothetical protein [Lewinellaceae bacterium]